MLKLLKFSIKVMRMFNLNLTLKDEEALYNLSTGIDNLGNVTLGVATFMGLISIDIVLFVAILNQEKKNNNHHRDHSNQTDWQLFWLSQWYFNRYDRHCCHSYEYHRHHRLDTNDYNTFLATTVLTSFLCTIVAVILALHFHLLTLALILAGVWSASFALKGIAWAIRPRLPEGEVLQEGIPMAQTTQTANEIPLVDATILKGPSASRWF